MIKETTIDSEMTTQDYKDKYDKLLHGMLGMSINGIKNNCHQYGNQYKMMFMDKKQKNRKTYNKGMIDGRLELINELEFWIVSEIGKKQISEYYKQFNVTYTDDEVIPSN